MSLLLACLALVFAGFLVGFGWVLSGIVGGMLQGSRAAAVAILVAIVLLLVAFNQHIPLVGR